MYVVHLLSNYDILRKEKVRKSQESTTIPIIGVTRGIRTYGVAAPFALGLRLSSDIHRLPPIALPPA